MNRTQPTQSPAKLSGNALIVEKTLLEMASDLDSKHRRALARAFRRWARRLDQSAAAMEKHDTAGAELN
jgi:hypothetical protein